MAFLRRLKQRVGRRGSFLAFLAVLDAVYAYSLLTLPGSKPPFLVLPADAWAAVWAFGSVVCAAGMFLRRDRIPFAIAAAVKFGWAALYTDLWMNGDVPQAWAGAIIWYGFAAIVLLVSSWPEEVSSAIINGMDMTRRRGG